MLHFLAVLIACGGGKPTPGDDTGGDSGSADTAETGETGETADTADTAETGQASLHGSPPEEAVPLPDFSATNRDGTGRGPEDLVGNPTVMWFYPAAATGG